MSDRLSREERRNIRRTLGETAAGALAEAKEEVQKLRGENLRLGDLVRALDERTKLHQQRLDAAMALGFQNEKAIGAARTHVLTLAEEQRAYVDGEDRKLRRRLDDHLEDLKAFQTFLGRLKWLVLGQ